MNSFSIETTLFQTFFYRRTSGGNRFGVFRPVVFGVGTAHLAAHQLPAAAPEARQVTGYLHRTAGGRKEFQPERKAFFADAGVNGFAVKLLNGNLQCRCTL